MPMPLRIRTVQARRHQNAVNSCTALLTTIGTEYLATNNVKARSQSLLKKSDLAKTPGAQWCYVLFHQVICCIRFPLRAWRLGERTNTYQTYLGSIPFAFICVHLRTIPVDNLDSRFRGNDGGSGNNGSDERRSGGNDGSCIIVTSTGVR